MKSSRSTESGSQRTEMLGDLRPIEAICGTARIVDGHFGEARRDAHLSHRLLDATQAFGAGSKAEILRQES